ncbi:sensor histidine kinase [Massilia pseudoviolaceinigra]|uniref:sensor histidine kinase n=1 Tax=Massilia pseudoviolaceinigra TaxID=3057165 RepID=UPI0027969BD5|nr:histidine kinase [Massilia sp. CCM 9206]MDQ1922273.1 histidine kinase [Massilia sp. CCM 9206]
MKASQLNKVMDFLRDSLAQATVLWWSFFDWLALVEWRQLFITWFLAMAFGLALTLPEPAIWYVILSYAVKVLAGGKRKAELIAREATEEAKVAVLERRLLEAQMATLQAQVEPHFLFNTLALIGQLIETDPPQAARIHMHLIEYLRSTLPQMRAPGGGTLGRQVQLSRAYLAIMQARMKERLTVSFDVPAQLEHMPFPPMMLQILIENAIKHGLEPKIEGGRIDVGARLVGDALHVDVRDNGVGFNMHAGDGVGLANIRERLLLLFGSRAELVIEMPVEGGALASLRVPHSSHETN